MFGLGTGELLVIFIALFFVFGASRLPELGKGLGQGIRSFRDSLKEPEHEDKNDSIVKKDPD